MADEALDYDEAVGNDAQGEDHEAAAQQPEEAEGQQASADDPMSLPPHGTEVFVSRVPREATEEQLRALLEQAGEIHSLRVPKDAANPSLNKGFVFCVYKERAAATAAPDKLNQAELPAFAGRKISVSPSQVKNRLFIGGVPREMTSEQLREKLVSAGAVGLQEVDIVVDKATGAGKGFGFLEFYNYAAADSLRRKLTRTEMKFEGGRVATVTWAERKPGEAEAERVKAIYVGSLGQDVTDADLRDTFGAFGTVTDVMLPRSKDDPSKHREYGFVHFTERSAALKAVEEAASGSLELKGKKLVVNLARPQMMQAGQGQGPAGYHQGGGGQGGGRFGGALGHRGGRGGPGGRFSGGRGGRGGFMPTGRGAYGHPASYDDGYGGAAAAAPAGGYAVGGFGGAGAMTMVPMMLPTGQVGYVLANASGAVQGAMGGGGGGYHGGGGRGGFGGYGGGGRGRGGRDGGQRFRPY